MLVSLFTFADAAFSLSESSLLLLLLLLSALPLAALQAALLPAGDKAKKGMRKHEG